VKRARVAPPLPGPKAKANNFLAGAMTNPTFQEKPPGGNPWVE